jgi:hypothetical protein
MSQSVRKDLPGAVSEVLPKQTPEPPEAPADIAQVNEPLSRLERLRQEFEANAAKLPAGDKSPFATATQHASRFWSKHSRASKALIGLLLVASVGWLPIRSLLQATSTEAVVNARLVTLRAPIEGEVEAPAGINVGTHFAAGDTVLRVVNRRAERARLDDLTRLIDQLESERASIASRIADMTAMHTELSNQLRSFQDGRLRQLTARGAEIASELAAARANRDAAQQALARGAHGDFRQHSSRNAGTLSARR